MKRIISRFLARPVKGGKVQSRRITPGEKFVPMTGGGPRLPAPLVVPHPLVRPFGAPVTKAEVQAVWDAYIKPYQDDAPSMEMRALTAILRATYQGLDDAGVK